MTAAAPQPPRLATLFQLDTGSYTLDPDVPAAAAKSMQFYALASAMGVDRVGHAAELLDRTPQEMVPLLPVLVPELQILLDRLQQHAPKLLFSLSTLMLLTELERRPAVSVMWAYALVEYSLRTAAVVTPKELVNVAMPHGFPTPAALRSTWLAQKVSPEDQRALGDRLGDNWLDRRQAWTF